MPSFADRRKRVTSLTNAAQTVFPSGEDTKYVSSILLNGGVTDSTVIFRVLGGGLILFRVIVPAGQTKELLSRFRVPDQGLEISTLLVAGDVEVTFLYFE